MLTALSGPRPKTLLVPRRRVELQRIAPPTGLPLRELPKALPPKDKDLPAGPADTRPGPKSWTAPKRRPVPLRSPPVSASLPVSRKSLPAPFRSAARRLPPFPEQGTRTEPGAVPKRRKAPRSRSTSPHPTPGRPGGNLPLRLVGHPKAPFRSEAPEPEDRFGADPKVHTTPKGRRSRRLPSSLSFPVLDLSVPGGPEASSLPAE
jgi:hypothetical protein